MLQTRRSITGVAHCCVGLLMLAACEHSAAFVAAPVLPLGPANTSGDVRLTFNPDQDYWPTWTEDAKGILYSYAQGAGHTDNDRCIGLLPAAGGTQIWSLCDTRVGQEDSSHSFSGAALGADGRLLYEEIVSRLGNIGSPDRMVVWLADTAAPFSRRMLATLPVFIGGTSVGVLKDVVWTAPDQFIALGADFQVVVANQPEPHLTDTVFTPLMVVHGTITPAGLTLIPIDGTIGAGGYSLVDGGSTVVFSKGLSIEQVPVTGGTPVTLATLPTVGSGTILGLTCTLRSCFVVTTEQQVSVTLANGSVVSGPNGGTVFGVPHVSPTSGLVVMEKGRKPGTDLYLFQGLLP